MFIQTLSCPVRVSRLSCRLPVLLRRSLFFCRTAAHFTSPLVSVSHCSWGLSNPVSDTGLCVSLSSVAEPRAKQCLLLAMAPTFPSVFCFLRFWFQTLSFHFQSENLLEITEGLQMPGRNSIKLEEISFLQTRLGAGLVFFVNILFRFGVGFCSVAYISKRTVPWHL